MDLAEASDVAAELGVAEGDLTDAQVLRIPSLLVKASYLFRQAAGRQFETGTYTQRLQVVAGRVRLPEQPVTSVDSVVDDCGNAVPFTESDGWLKVDRHNSSDVSFHWHNHPAGSGWFVTVTYTGGGVPDVVRVAVAQMVARALNVDPAPATGVKNQMQVAGPFTNQVSYFEWAAESVALSAEERRLAETFRYPGTTLILQRP